MITLDTDVATLAAYGDPRVRERLSREPISPTPDVTITIVTRAEILRGRIDSVLKAGTADELIRAQDRLAEAEEFLGRYPVLRIDRAAAVMSEQLRRTGKFRRRYADLLNACIAIAHDARLFTRNPKDYDDIPGLKTIPFVI